MQSASRGNRPCGAFRVGVFLVGALLWVAQVAPAQGARPYWRGLDGYEALHQALRDVASDARMLVVASHPDDRYVMPAAYFRFRYGWRVAALLATRGEGGQNSRGPEIGDDLGRIRTLESEACAAALDTDVYYLNRQDGGFCRTGSEALRVWGRESTVQEMARLLRSVRPDVVLTTHHAQEGHGHDLALIEILPEAVRLAADAEFVTVGLAPIEIRAVWCGVTPDEEPVVELVMTELEPLRGKTYRRLAYEALLQHRSSEPIQPMATLFEPIVRLRPMSVFEDRPASAATLAGSGPSMFDALPDGAAGSLARDLEGLGANARLAARAELVPVALRLRQRLTDLDLPADGDLRARRARRVAALDRVVRHAAGFDLRVEVAGDRVAVPGMAFPFEIHVHNGGPFAFENLTVRSLTDGDLEFGGESGGVETLANLESGRPRVFAATYTARNDPDLDALFRGDTFEPPVQIECSVAVVHDGSRHQLRFAAVVPTEVRPAVELEVIPHALLLPQGKREIPFAVRVTRNTTTPVRDRLVVNAQAGFVVDGSPVLADLARSTVQDFPFVLRVPRGQAPGVYTLHIRLGDLRMMVPVHKVDVHVPEDLDVGLIRGVDDTSNDVLSGLVGRRLHVFGEQELAVRDLSDLDTIVVDVRALRSSQRRGIGKAARAAFSRLLEFARGGGRLVVFYHKDTEFNVADTGFEGAPFDLHIGKGRTTREDAPIEILRPEHPLLQTPNRIGPQDWDGWVQERGLYFPDVYDRRYVELVGMADPGQPRERGALLYATSGSGDYVYCAMSLYRQLKSLHPGACRLFANLIAHRRP